MTFEVSGGSTLSGLLYAQAMREPHAPAILAPGRSPLTYAGLWRQTQRIARSLNARGASPATRVALVLPNGPEMAAAALGVAACVTCVPLNPACQEAECRSFLTDAGVQLVLMLRTERRPIRTVAQELGLRVLEIKADALLAAGEFRLDAGTGEDFRMEWCGELQDHAFVLHTSGTTARPKIVPLTHANVTSSAHRIANDLRLDASDRCLNVMPLFHGHGLIGALLATVAAGGSIVCTPGFDHQSFFGWIAQFEPTWYTAVPTIHQWVVANRGQYKQAAPAHGFRFVRSCSSALPSKTFEAMQALTGSPVIEAYGMTEASHQIASNPLSGPRKAGSVGLPAGAEVALVDSAGRFLASGAAGVTGEIVVRGRGVMSGYENDPEANAAAFIDGWFRTGDQGRFDDEGYLYVTGRIKDTINRGGEKISPREIDEVLLEHDDVREAAAFAMPHPTLGQDVAAAVVLREAAAADEPALRCFLLDRLAPSKVPSSIVFVSAIPTEATGKVQRTGLFARLQHLMAKPVRAPSTETEKSLEAIFCSVLDCDGVGADDNFFALGGDSLKAAQVISRILAQHGVDLTIPTLFTHGTIAQLAVVVERAREAADKRRQDLAAEIEQMSDEEVARLLAEEERKGPTSWA